MGYVRNSWYVAAWAGELDAGPIARRVLDEPLVLYRSSNGEPVALYDMCPHRLLPLSKGRLKGDHLECGYHGMTFDPSGQCVRIPGQNRIPPSACVRSYPVVEHFGMIWVWTGDPEQVDRSALFRDLPWGDPGWGLNEGPYTYVGCRYELLIENLVDPAHVSWVHQSTLGTAAMEDISIDAEHDDHRLTVFRWTPNSPAPPILRTFVGDDLVDRWQYYHWYPPSVAVVDFSVHPPGTGTSEEARQQGHRMYSCHFLTPETATTTHYFWFQLRNFAVDDESVSELITKELKTAFSEDKGVLEAIQQREAEPGAQRSVRLAFDGGSTRLHRTLARLVAADEGDVRADA